MAGRSAAASCAGDVSGDLVIEEKAWRHILEGDLSHGEVTKIKGGLHTFAGLDHFLQSRPDISNLDFKISIPSFYAKRAPSWYHLFADPKSRVGYLRLPKSAFTDASLKSLWQADLSTHGGYLWKTLFPRDLAPARLREELGRIYRERLSVEDRGWAEVIEGFIDVGSDARISVKVVVDRKTRKLVSAYPSFQQSRSLKNTLTISRGLLISNVIAALNPDVSRSLRDRVEKLAATPVRGHSFLGIYDYRPWRELMIARRREILKAIYFSSLLGGPSGAETALRANDPTYKHGSLMRFAQDVVEAMIRDPEIGRNEKLATLTTLVSLHKINTSTHIEDFLWARYLLGTFLEFISYLEESEQRFAIEAIENAPSFWTLLVPLPKSSLDAREVRVTALRILSHLGPSSTLTEGGPDDAENLTDYVKWASPFADLATVYFSRLDRLEEGHPGFFGGSEVRRKFLSDHITAAAQMMSMAEAAARSGGSVVKIYGEERDMADVLSPWAGSRYATKFGRRLKPFVRYLEWDSGTWWSCVAFFEAVAKKDSRALLSYNEGFNLELKPFEIEKILGPDRPAPNVWDLTFPILIPVFGKNGEFLIRPRLVPYTFSR